MFDSLDDKRSYLNDLTSYDLDSIEPDLIIRKDSNYHNLEINLDQNNKYFNISNQFESYTLNNDQLDISLREFTSNITFAEVNSLNRDLKFSDQSIFQGTINNDLIKVDGRSDIQSASPLNISTSFLGTPGNDFYFGDKSSIDLVDYSKLEDFNLNNLGYKVDVASGLKIYDKNSFLNIESNNSPLINRELNLDSLIVNKNDVLSKIDIDNIDIIEDIELLRLTPNDDIVNIGLNNKDNIYDFISGDDIVVYTAENIPNDFCNFINLDKFQWRPLDSSGNKIKDDRNSDVFYDFDLNYFKEDEKSSFLIESYDSNNFLPKDINSVQLGHFNPLLENANKLDWLKVKLVDPLPEIVNQGQPVIKYELVPDNEDSNLNWLEINVYDYRPHGEGFLGAELNLDWSNDSIFLDESLLENENVFGNDRFPIFQNLGSLDQNDDFSRTILRGLSGGSLPVASQGIILGNMQSQVPDVQFARLPFRFKSSDITPDINLTLKSLPASKARKVSLEKVIMINSNSPKALVVEGLPLQDDVGSHLVKIISDDTKGKNFIINVESINDVPIPVNFDSSSSNPLEQTIFQDQSFTQDLSLLFSDEDDENLTFTLKDFPDWIQKEGSLIYGTPSNADVGINEIILSASDGENESSDQKISINVLNINDAPEIISSINLPEITQGESFNYPLTSNSFFDKDTIIDQNEKLTFEVYSKEGNKDFLRFITIERDTGNILISSDHTLVGNNQFTVRASDKEGLFIDQDVQLNVLNINDSPFLTEKIPNFENPITLSFDEETDFNINSWFDDYDLGIDPNEKITFTLFEDDGSGVLKEINEETSNWLVFDNSENILKIRPIGEKIGTNYIVINAKDSQGLEASATIPIIVKYRNNNPVLNYKNSQDLINNFLTSGVNSMIPETINNDDNFLNRITFNLNEQSDFLIDLPFDLLKDIDVGTDPDENLTYRVEDLESDILSNSYANLFQFNQSNLRITGNTTDLGLDSTNGIVEYKTNLIVKDNYGLENSIELFFNLERSIKEPQVFAKTNEINIDEGDNIGFAEFFDFNHDPVNGESFNLYVKDSSIQGGQLIFKDSSGILIEKNSDNLDYGDWLFSGTFEDIQKLINDLNVSTLNPYAKGDFEFSILMQSRLGETNLRTQSQIIKKSFFIDALPSIPKFNFNNSEINSSNPYSLTKLDSLFNAYSDDSEEQIFYLINFPLERTDLFITDSTTSEIGTNTELGILLTNQEFADALIRSRNGNTESFNFSFSAISKEVSNSKQIQSPVQYLELFATPIINEEAGIALIPPIGVQNSGLLSEITVLLDVPLGTRTIELSIDLPNGSKVNSLENLGDIQSFSEQLLSENLKRFTYLISVKEDKLPEQMKINVLTDESFSGELNGSLDFYTSSREYSDISENSLSKQSDILNKIASINSGNQFNWNVIQNAKKPEFIEDNQLFFDETTGKLSIAVRRGGSESGFRNPNESISLSISNIPTGFTLAEKIGSDFRPVGATDKFGTIALFIFPSLEEENAGSINSFDYVNNNNLYLVSLQDNNQNIQNNSELNLSISSLISGQEGGDSRSKIAFNNINLKSFSNLNNIPTIQKNNLIVDPLILSLKDDKSLNLKSVNQSNVLFSMLPGSAPLKTGWIENNNLELNNAFLAINNSGNDSSDEISINTITELFSEYFGSNNGLRTFNSGVSALASIDSDNNLIINSEDNNWEKLLLWFDDGDAISEINELYPVQDFLSSINLDTYEIMKSQPIWNNDNQIMGSVNVTSSDNLQEQFKLFDVGLTINPSLESSLDLNVRSNNSEGDFINIFENGETVEFYLDSSGSENWSEEGLDSLTLVRLSGLPNEVTPSLGIKDSRGDWLFTWSDLIKNGGSVKLFPPALWSGFSNLSFLISQLQPDGSLVNSSIITYAMNVSAVPTAPLLKLTDLEINEDESIKLKEMISIGQLIDNDGSEKLHYEINSQTDNFNLYTLNSSDEKVFFSKTNNSYIISSEVIDNVFVSPLENFSGKIEFSWKAVATETSNNLSKEVSRNNTLFVNAVADKPLPISSINNNSVLIENKSLALNEFIDVLSFDNGLLDLDGSEEIRYQIEVPSYISILKSDDNNWSPLSLSIEDDKTFITVQSDDLPYLEIADNGFSDELIEFSITRISREISNANQLKSLSTKIEIPFNKNARPADVVFNETTMEEDSLGISLNQLFTITPYSQTDTLRYVVEDLNSNLEIYKKENNTKLNAISNEININNLDDYLIKSKSNISGKFSFSFFSISSPKGKGAEALSQKLDCQIEVLPIADTPILTFQNPPEEKIEISSNGWVNLHELGLNVDSEDNDNSEEYSILISPINNKGEIIQFPEQVIFNAPYELSDGSYEIKKKYLNNLSLFIDKTTDDLLISLTPKSIDQDSELIGISTQLTVKANLEKIIVKVPLLQVSGTIQGQEDVPFPVLSNAGGSILSQHRDKGLGQTLFLELNNLPEGSRIVEKLNSDSSNSEFSTPINLDSSGNLLKSLRLPYQKWESLYLSAPENKNGTIEFNARSISIGDESLEEKSTQNLLVKAFLVPVNDAPLVINLDDLERADEGLLKYWNLKSRFFDHDNEISDLRIDVKIKNDLGSYNDLPNWLSLDNNGILSSNANNDNVGIYTLLIEATDPLGGQVKQEVKLDIGNINQNPTFKSLPSNWNEISTDNIKEFETTIFLDQTRIIDLANTFDDVDIKHGDSLSFQISDDGLNWSDNLTNLASITTGTLFINPLTKKQTGVNNIYVRAIDLQGASSSIKLKINILNVNEPPFVNRSEAIKISQSIWQEKFNLIPDKAEFKLDLLDLFIDPDETDTIEEIFPVLPPWLNLERIQGRTGMLLVGNPKIGDIGTETLDFTAFDQSGKTITYRLILEVQNINDAPILKENPDFSSFKEVINGIPTVSQSSYERFDPGILFDDEDFPYGDSLSYELVDVLKINEDIEESLENPDWISFSYKTSKIPENNGKLLVRPAFYAQNENGEFIREIDVNDLSSLNENTKLKVSIIASDKRDTELKGLIGADFDVLTSNSLEIVENSIKITSELPLFNQIIRDSNGFRVEAGSAPDLGIGGSVGDESEEELASFEVLVKNTDLKMMVSITPGIGEFRDGFNTRNADNLDENNSVIHSVSNQDGADIEILAPDNNDVGLYKIKIKAQDQIGESVVGSMFLSIKNLNEKPIINSSQILKIREFIESTRFENSTEISEVFNLFNDPDIIHLDKLKLEIQSEDEDNIFNDPKFANSISIQSDNKGNLRFKFEPPRGFNEVVSPRFKIIANDNENLSAESPIFTANFFPKSEVTLLTSGIDKNQLSLENLGNIINKNITIDLDNALNINSPELLDSFGDELFVNLKIKSNNSSIISDLENVDDFIDTSDLGEEKILHRININKLALASGNNFGDLSGLKLEVDPNSFYEIPSNLSSQIKFGIPIEIWTTTRVIDDEIEDFGSEDSIVSRIWLPVRNNPPDFVPAKPIKLDKNFNFNENEDTQNILFDLTNNFTDNDHNDILSWKLNLPDKLENLIKLDPINGNVYLNNTVKKLEDLPLGNHRILITAEDSTYQLGDKSAKVKGSLRINVVDNDNTENLINGINLINELDASEIREIFSRADKQDNEISLTDQEKDLVNIFERLKINDENRNNLIEKISNGSAAIFNNFDESSPLVLLDSMSEDELLLLNSERQELSDEMILESQLLLGEKDFIDSPIGQLEFTLETNEQKGAFVDIFLESGGADIDELIKTNSLNIPNIFESKTLTFNSRGEVDLEDWLKGLSYGIYDYSNSNQNIIIDSFNRDSDLSGLNFSDEIISKIDGSAFLIDTDEDGLIDIISMFLLDQGYFDNDSREFIIKDPLIPVDTNEEVLDEDLSSTSNNFASNSTSSKDLSIDAGNKLVIKNLGNNIDYGSKESLSLAITSSKFKDFKGKYIPELLVQGIKPLKSLYGSFDSLITKNKNNLEKLRDSIETFFEEYNNNGFLGFLTLMFLPVAGERILTPITKNLNLDYKLDLVRRNPHFSGRWYFISAKGNKYIITRGFNNLELSYIDDPFEDEYIKPIFGFDIKNNSLLYKAFLKSKQPGLFLDAIQKIQFEYQDINSFEINWSTWINENLLNHIDIDNKYNRVLCKSLIKLIDKSNSINICITDITMFAHIVDCCENLNLPIKKLNI